MATLRAAVDDFLAQKRIAVAGVSRDGTAAANGIYNKLKKAGYEVFPVNPNATDIKGDPCFADIGAIPGGVDGVVVATHPQVSAQVVRDAAAAGVTRAWLHRSFGEGSVAADAIRVGREQNMTVIDGGCPMMFCEPVDIAHKCMRWFLNATGKLPSEV